MDATFQLRGGWELNGHVERDFVNFQDSTYADYTVGSAGGPVYLPAEDFSGFVVADQGDHADLAAVRRLRCSTGAGGRRSSRKAATGNGWQLTGELDLRPVSTVRMALTGTVFRLDRLDGREFARSTIPRLKVEYQPRRELFFRAIGEYRSDRTAALEDPATGAPLFIGGAAQPATEFNGLRRGPARLVRADAGDGGVPRLRQLARDRRGVQLVPAVADDRRVLREAGVPDPAVAAGLGRRG